MTRSAALAIISRHSAPPVGDDRVIPFPRRAHRRSDGRMAHASGAPGPSERIDAVIKRTWGLQCAGEMSEAAAGELHDELNSLRGSLAKFRETAPR